MLDQVWTYFPIAAVALVVFAMSTGVVALGSLFVAGGAATGAAIGMLASGQATTGGSSRLQE